MPQCIVHDCLQACHKSLASCFNDITRLAERIVRDRYTKVAIQLPDVALNLAAQYQHALCTAIKIEADKAQHSNVLPRIVVLADTSSGTGCCVDEAAAEHYATDCIIHLGDSCQSRTASRTPVLYSFPRSRFSASQWLQAVEDWAPPIPSTPPLALVLLYDLDLHHALLDILQAAPILLRNWSKVYIAVPRLYDHLPLEAPTPPTEQTLEECIVNDRQALDDQLVRLQSRYFCGRKIFECCLKVPDTKNQSTGAKDTEDPRFLVLKPYVSDSSSDVYAAFTPDPSQKWEFLYLGSPVLDDPDTAFFRTFMLRFGSDYPVNLYIPPTSIATDKTASVVPATQIPAIPRFLARFLMSCYTRIETARSAHVIGIVYGTVGVLGHTETHKRLRDLCKNQKKQVISLVVGKITVPKLENFPEVDVFCLVACPQSAFISNPRDFSKPILTPFELEVALDARPWDTQYVLDMGELLQQAHSVSTVEESLLELEESLASSPCRLDSPAADTQSSLAHKESTQQSVVLKSFMDHLTPISSRTFQGVEVFAPPSSTPELPTVYEGRSGVASGYQNERCPPES